LTLNLVVLRTTTSYFLPNSQHEGICPGPVGRLTNGREATSRVMQAKVTGRATWKLMTMRVEMDDCEIFRWWVAHAKQICMSMGCPNVHSAAYQVYSITQCLGRCS
jgi:hypothetical protein